jgi:hypothetical protein
MCVFLSLFVWVPVNCAWLYVQVCKEAAKAFKLKKKEGGAKKGKADTKLTALEKKKLAAKAQKERIMAQMAAQQSKFSEKNKSALSEADEAERKRKAEQKQLEAEDAVVHTCIICRDSAQTQHTQTLGLLALLQVSALAKACELPPSTPFTPREWGASRLHKAPEAGVQVRLRFALFVLLSF